MPIVMQFYLTKLESFYLPIPIEQVQQQVSLLHDLLNKIYNSLFPLAIFLLFDSQVHFCGIN